MIRSSLWLVLLASPAFAAPVPKELKREIKLEGAWKLVSCDCTGTLIIFKNNEHWTVDGELNLHSHVGPKPNAQNPPGIRFIVDTKTKPMHLDFKYLNTPTQRPGIFELSNDGNTLKICINMNAQDRPTAIEAGKLMYLYTLERVKPEDAK